MSAILRAKVGKNYLVALEQQLIASLLNQGGGVSTPADIQMAIDAAQALVQQQGGPLSGSAKSKTKVVFSGKTYTASQLNSILASFNEGTFPGGPPHCDA